MSSSDDSVAYLSYCFKSFTHTHTQNHTLKCTPCKQYIKLAMTASTKCLLTQCRGNLFLKSQNCHVWAWKQWRAFTQHYLQGNKGTLLFLALWLYSSAEEVLVVLGPKEPSIAVLFHQQKDVLLGCCKGEAWWFPQLACLDVIQDLLAGLAVNVHFMQRACCQELSETQTRPLTE